MRSRYNSICSLFCNYSVKCVQLVHVIHFDNYIALDYKCSFFVSPLNKHMPCLKYCVPETVELNSTSWVYCTKPAVQVWTVRTCLKFSQALVVQCSTAVPYEYGIVKDTDHISVGSALINNFVTTFHSKYSMDMLLPYKECMAHCLRVITSMFISFKQLSPHGCYRDWLLFDSMSHTPVI